MSNSRCIGEPTVQLQRVEKLSYNTPTIFDTVFAFVTYNKFLLNFTATNLYKVSRVTRLRDKL